MLLDGCRRSLIFVSATGADGHGNYHKHIDNIYCQEHNCNTFYSNIIEYNTTDCCWYAARFNTQSRITEGGHGGKRHVHVGYYIAKIHIITKLIAI